MICGKYGAQKIVDTPAPTEFDKCPDGYSICNPKTSDRQQLESQYCLKNELYPQECPILELDFKPTSKLSEVTDPDWYKLAYSDSLSLIYTKKGSSNAPLTHTYVGVAPCLDPMQLVKKADI